MTSRFFQAATLSALSALSAIPTGWSVHTDRTAVCQFATPPDWKSDPITHSVWSSPSGKSTVVISAAQGQTLVDAKGVMEGNFPPEKTFEDSTSRLWYEYTSGGRSANWYVGVAVKAGVCGATLSFKDAGDEPVMKQIANTVGAK